MTKHLFQKTYGLIHSLPLGSQFLSDLDTVYFSCLFCQNQGDLDTEIYVIFIQFMYHYDASVSKQTSLKSRHLTESICEQKTLNIFGVTDKNKLLFTSNIYNKTTTIICLLYTVTAVNFCIV